MQMSSGETHNNNINDADKMYSSKYYRCYLHTDQLSNFSVLLKRGSDCCLEDNNDQLPDDVARQHMCYDCEQLIESHRKHRTEHIFRLVENVNKTRIS